MGALPSWYANIRAARYLGVSPWDLEERSVRWQHRALCAEWAEARAAEDKAKMER